MHRRSLAAFALVTLTLTGFASAQSVVFGPPPPLNDNCAWPWYLVGEGTAVWDSSFVPTTGFDGGGVSSIGGQDCSYTVERDMFYVWQATECGDYVLDTVGSSMADTIMHVHAGNDCSAVCIEGNDDAFGPNSQSQVLLFGVQAGDEFLVQMGSKDPADMGVGFLNVVKSPVAPSCIYASFCDPANPHAGGGTVTLTEGVSCQCDAGPGISFFGTGIGSDLHLGATGGPEDAFGFFIVSETATSNLVIFEGILCLDAPQARYSPQIATNSGLSQLSSIGQFDAAGVFQNLAGNATSTGGAGFDVPLELPFSPIGQVIAPGASYCFQLWYRDQAPDGSPSANFSNGICVQW